jgi:formate hydrogenlyase subunit 4
MSVGGAIETGVRAAGQAAVLLLLPPLLLGVINRTKAFFAGRAGPPVLQPYFDLAKLLRKGTVRSRTTSWVFRAGPVVTAVTALLGAALVPVGPAAALVGFEGDFMLLAYLLGLGRVFTMLAALDTGSSFEGMGAARAAVFSCLAEPALFLSLLVLARAGGSLSLSHMLGPGLGVAWSQAGASFVLVAAGLFIVLLAEGSRIPVDDPDTHLELTMVHEVMVLDHGGPALGLASYGAALKLFIYASLLARLCAPCAGLGDAGWIVYLAAVLAVAILVGVVESTVARLRVLTVPSLLVAACLLSAFGIVLLVR